MFQRNLVPLIRSTSNSAGGMFREVCVIFLILNACTLNGTSAKNTTTATNKFNSMLFANGTARCILDVPTVALVSRSVLSCGVKCLSSPLCSFYNYISTSKGCQLFYFTVIKFGTVKSCRSYQLQGVSTALRIYAVIFNWRLILYVIVLRYQPLSMQNKCFALTLFGFPPLTIMRWSEYFVLHVSYPHLTWIFESSVNLPYSKGMSLDSPMFVSTASIQTKSSFFKNL